MRNLLKHGLAALVMLCCSLAFATEAEAQAAPPPSTQLEQLVAPIALYPDSLVAQILAAATYPTEVVQAWQWSQQHPTLQGQDLADGVDSQSWDASVKALTQFPSVLDNMNANLGWTSALGDTYANQPDAVLEAIQVMRLRAQSAGTLYSTSQQTVTMQDQSIAIEPVSPEVVYVPAYDPWLVYGDPLAVYPGWVEVPGVFWGGPDLYWGTGFGIGLLGGAAWGWHHWGFDWHHRKALHDHSPYEPHGPTFAHHHDQGGANGDHRAGGAGDMHDRGPRGRERSPGVARPPRPDTHAHAGTAFSGFDHGGVARGYSSRGRSSLGEGFPMEAARGGGSHAGAGVASPRAGGSAHIGGGAPTAGSFGGSAHGGGGGGHR